MIELSGHANQAVPSPDRSATAYRVSLAVVVVSAAAIRLLFWIETRWTIEDALIIARMARNFAQYHVLSFNLGAPVSSATSWLFALLAGGFVWLGMDAVAAAKTMGLVASTATCALVFDLLCGLESVAMAAVASILYVFLPPVVAYSVGGMETAVYTLFCCLAMERALRGGMKRAFLAASMAFLLRPDGILIFFVLACYAAWKGRSMSAFMCWIWPSALLLLVGFSAHRLYYGAWLPQTVLAKSLGYPVDPLKNSLRYVKHLLFAQPAGLVVYVLALWGFYRSLTRCRDLSLLAIWYVVYYAFFALRAPLFEWYLQPPLVVLCYFAGLGVVEGLRIVAERLGSGRAGWVVPATGGALLVGVLLVEVALYARGRLEAQRYEDSVRGAISRWIAKNAARDALIFTESLGYIGYQNENPFVDWPGLVSREVPGVIVSAGAKGNRRRGYDAVIANFHPDLLALRIEEWTRLAPFLKQKYQLCAEFRVTSSAGEPYIVARRILELESHDQRLSEGPAAGR